MLYILYTITSCSPGWVRYIEMNYPEYLPDLHPENVFKDWLTKYQHLDYIAGHTYPAFKLDE